MSKKSYFNKCGNILISDQFNNRVIEIDKRGEIIWSFGNGLNDLTETSIIGVNDAQRIGKSTLMAGTGIPPNVLPSIPAGVVDNRVIIVSERKKILWQYGQFGLTGSGVNLLNTPVQCTYVPKNHKHYRHHSIDFELEHLFDGTILITDQGNNRIIEVNDEKDIIWEFPNSPNILSSPNSAEKLENNNVLIADENNNRAIEVSQSGNILKIFNAKGTLGTCAFASRLENGHTLLTDGSNNRIVEVDVDDNIVWQYYTNTEFNSVPNPIPTRGLRLKNNSTIISDQFNNRVIIIGNTTNILENYGLPFENNNVGSIGNNFGFDINTTQLGLYAPYDAKVI